jgi:hypothetical protein
MSVPNLHPDVRIPYPSETAQYTREMLESLKKIAVQQHQHLLAHLLDLAALEAKSLGKGQDQEILLP